MESSEIGNSSWIDFYFKYLNDFLFHRKRLRFTMLPPGLACQHLRLRRERS